MAYFNEFAGSDPSRVLLTGCDLDCGQDVFRLAQELRKRQVTNVHLALWTSANLNQMGLPHFDVLEPAKPVTGWVAVGVRSLRLGEIEHETYPPGSLAWLDAYHPAGHAGATIFIYCIPDLKAAESNLCSH